MSSNPYAPPTTDVERGGSIPPRPISVWLLLVALCVGLLFLLVGSARALLVVSQHAAGGSQGSLILAAAWRLALIAAIAFMAVSIYRRRLVGRWLGFATIVGITVAAIASPDSTQYANDAQRAGGSIARLTLFPAVCAWWAYAFALSRKSRRYFSGATAR